MCTVWELVSCACSCHSVSNTYCDSELTDGKIGKKLGVTEVRWNLLGKHCKCLKNVKERLETWTSNCTAMHLTISRPCSLFNSKEGCSWTATVRDPWNNWWRLSYHWEIAFDKKRLFFFFLQIVPKQCILGYWNLPGINCSVFEFTCTTFHQNFMLFVLFFFNE